MKPARRPWTLQRLGLLGACLLLSGPLTGCIIAGYSTGRGGFVYPGGFVLLFVVLLVLFLLRRR